MNKQVLPHQNADKQQVIFSTQSDINGKIDVVEIGSTRKLRVENIDQSMSWNAPNAKRLVWGQAVKIICEEEPDLKRVLILGLGGATVQHMLSRQLPEAKIYSVDVDPTMVDVARNYFDVDSIKNHKVILADACRLIIEPEKYDLQKQMFNAVYIDIFVGSRYPDLGKSGNFVANVLKMAMPGGLIMFNRSYLTDHQDEVNNFVDFVEGFLKDVETKVVAGYTNSDNILIYGRV